MKERKSVADTPAPVNFGALLKDVPPGAWVAISPDKTKVLAYAADMRDAIAKAREKYSERPIVFRVPQKHAALVL
jgi:hypothetical protein